ncbi:hypothetical protein H5W18_00260 [Lactobacillus sp. Marseille-P7033]|nr:hypothetical protein [Lactobacillus sp. Marseille-P7033]
MEIKITGTPEEIEKLFNAIGGSKEQSLAIDDLWDSLSRNALKRYKPTD